MVIEDTRLYPFRDNRYSIVTMKRFLMRTYTFEVLYQGMFVETVGQYPDSILNQYAVTAVEKAPA